MVVVGAGVSGLATAYFLRRLLGARASITVLDAATDVGGKVRTDHAGRPARSTPGRTPSSSRAPELRDADRRPRPGRRRDRAARRRRPTSGRAAGCGRCHRAWPSACPNAWSRCCARGCSRPRRLCAPGSTWCCPPAGCPRTPPWPSWCVRASAPGCTTGWSPRSSAASMQVIPARLSAGSTVPEITALARSGRSIYLTLRRRRRAAPRPTGPAPCSAGLPVRRPRPAHHAPCAMPSAPDVVRARGGRHPRRAAVRRRVRRAHRPGHLAPPARSCWPPRRTSPPSCSASWPPAARRPAERDPLRRRRERHARVPPRDLPALPSGSGFLVPPVEGELIVGCTWLTQKWPHLAGRDVVLVKSMVGRSGDRRWLEMSDEQLVDAVREGLSRMLGTRGRAGGVPGPALAGGHAAVRRGPRRAPRPARRGAHRTCRAWPSPARPTAASGSPGAWPRPAPPPPARPRESLHEPPHRDHRPTFGRLLPAADAGVLGGHPGLPARLPALPGLGDARGAARRADRRRGSRPDRPGRRVRSAVPDPGPHRWRLPAPPGRVRPGRPRRRGAASPSPCRRR